ncbi:MAG: hypothetical protein WEE66_11100 [Actinomycetota bacterium]
MTDLGLALVLGLSILLLSNLALGALEGLLGGRERPPLGGDLIRVLG